MNALVFGAGKIARGFLGQLLYRTGCRITFVDASADLVDALNKAGGYYVNVMGNPDACEWIDGFRCVSLDDKAGVADAYAEADVVFTAVGGKNIASLGKRIAEIVSGGDGADQKTRNIICCENWDRPAQELSDNVKEELSAEAWERFCETTGVSEAAVMRSGIEPDETLTAIDPLGVSVSDFWELPVDLDRIVGDAPKIEGVVYLRNFGNFLQRKVYTFNGSNALIAYVGSLMKYKYLADAANDPWIVSLLDEFYGQLDRALCQKFDAPLEEQRAFSKKAKAKYQDRTIVDLLERHARDPVRKLSPSDRLVGPARLIEEAGMEPDVSALAIAAALYYASENESDASAMALSEMREREGALGAMTKVCGIEMHSKLGEAVAKQIAVLQKKGLIA